MPPKAAIAVVPDYLAGDDDYQRRADDTLWKKWREVIQPEAVLRMLFLGGFQTQDALEELQPGDLEACAKLLHTEILPGHDRAWQNYMQNRNKDAEDDVNGEVERTAEPEGAKIGELERRMHVFDPANDCVRAGAKLLEEGHVEIKLDWGDVGTHVRIRERGKIIKMGLTIAGRDWNLVVYPHGECGKGDTGVFEFYLDLLSDNKKYTRHPEFPMNTVFDLRDSEGLTKWHWESFTCFQNPRGQPGFMYGACFQARDFAEDLQSCHGDMHLHLFFRYYKPTSETLNWGVSTFGRHQIRKPRERGDAVRAGPAEKRKRKTCTG